MPLSPTPAEAPKRPERAMVVADSDRDLKELVSQIQKSRKVAEESVQKLYELSTQLQSRARRSPFDGASAYVIFANAHLRMAGALGQGFRRTASMDRVLDVAKAEQEEARRQEAADEERRKIRESQRRVQKLTLTSDDDFDSVYGDIGGEMNHAE
jgi:hypothetical protein